MFLFHVEIVDFCVLQIVVIVFCVACCVYACLFVWPVRFLCVVSLLVGMVAERAAKRRRKGTAEKEEDEEGLCRESDYWSTLGRHMLEQ